MYVLYSVCFKQEDWNLDSTSLYSLLWQFNSTSIGDEPQAQLLGTLKSGLLTETLESKELRQLLA